jgi:PAS domain S-box-containing protein
MSKHDLFPSVLKAGERLAALRARLQNESPSGATIEISSALHDVEEMLKEVRSRYSLMCQILDQTSDAVFAKDIDGRYSMINPNGAAMLGRTVAQVLGSDDTDLFEAEDAERIMAADREVLRTEESCTREETFAFQGVPTSVRTTRSAWYDAEGKLRGLIGTSHEVTDRRRADDEDALDRDRLRSMASGIVIAEERQRRSLAADLHDGLGQEIALARMKLSALRRSASADLHEPLAGIEELIERADRSIRSITFQISPPPLYDLGLLPALQWLAEDHAGRYGIRVRIEDDHSPGMGDEGTRVILFHAVRELLINAAAHGGESSEVVVRLGRDGGSLRISVEDGGRGFDTKDLESRRGGLLRIRELLRHAGGSVVIDSMPGHGTTVTLTAPLETRRPAWR